MIIIKSTQMDANVEYRIDGESLVEIDLTDPSEPQAARYRLVFTGTADDWERDDIDMNTMRAIVRGNVYGIVPSGEPSRVRFIPRAELYIGAGNQIEFVDRLGVVTSAHSSANAGSWVEIIAYTIDGERIFPCISKRSIVSVNGSPVVIL